MYWRSMTVTCWATGMGKGGNSMLDESRTGCLSLRLKVEHWRTELEECGGDEDDVQQFRPRSGGAVSKRETDSKRTNRKDPLDRSRSAGAKPLPRTALQPRPSATPTTEASWRAGNPSGNCWPWSSSTTALGRPR